MKAVKVERQEHYGWPVYTNLMTDPLRREQCLCLNCHGFEKCEIAPKLFELCEKEHLAVMVTRCPGWWCQVYPAKGFPQKESASRGARGRRRDE